MTEKKDAAKEEKTAPYPTIDLMKIQMEMYGYKRPEKEPGITAAASPKPKKKAKAPEKTIDLMKLQMEFYGYKAKDATLQDALKLSRRREGVRNRVR